MLLSPSDTPSMSNVRVSVVLAPLSLDNPLPRSFTLSADNPLFNIGRSSKRDIKNRIPASNNGWFDSRVMSRDHAQFSIGLDKQNIYICDTCSTHGTWLNNVRLIDGEKTPLINGDVLRFGVNVDRGDEEFPALTVACKIEWRDWVEEEWANPEVISNAQVARIKPPIEPMPQSSLRPSSSTNTFCVPDDSDVEELPNPTAKFTDEAVDVFPVAAPRASPEVFPRAVEDNPVSGSENRQHDMPKPCEARDLDSIILEERSDDYLESDEEESDLESSAPPSPDPYSFSYASDGIDAKSDRDDMYDESSGSDSESDSESESDGDSAVNPYEDLLDKDQNRFINPDLLKQNNNSDAAAFGHTSKSFAENVASTEAPIKTETTGSRAKHSGPVLVEVCGGIRHPHPHSVIAREELPPCVPLTLESNHYPFYQDGPFSYTEDPGPKEAADDTPMPKPAVTPLKRKASELETQDAQVVESVPPATQADLEALSQREVVDAISSALSETEPPKKRAKSSHSSSGAVASYTATAVISALLGGLGTIALLAALPAEYFR